MVATGGWQQVGTHETVDGREPTSQKFMRALEEHFPQFSWRLDVLALENYKLAQSRIRVFIRGLWKGIVSQVPAPLAPFGKTTNIFAVGAIRGQ